MPTKVPTASADLLDIKTLSNIGMPDINALTTHIADARNAADDLPDNPCLSCGACCAHFRVSFYFGELADQAAGWVPIALTSKVNDFRAAMKGTEMGNNRCIALQGEVGKAGVSCSIYAYRPSPCREFSAWEEDGTPNPDCQRLRAQRGLPALKPLTDLR